MSKPTIVLIPGAWHTPTPYLPLLDSLQALGFPTVSKKLPSVISPDPSADETPADSITLNTDIAYAREHIILPELEKNDVVLVLHSYGGIVGGGAAQGLGPADRKAQGHAHSVRGLIYLCALVGFEGKPLLNSKEELQPWAVPNEECTRIRVPDPNSVFYEQLSEQEQATATAGLQHHAYGVFSTPNPPQAYTDAAYDGRCVYVRCHVDRAIPLTLQDIFIEATKETAKWTLEDLKEASHSPFLSHKKETAAIVEKWANEWV